MKKFLIVFTFCFLAILTTYILTNYGTNLEVITENIENFIGSMFKKETITYSDDFKVNRLQMSKATYYYDKLNDNQKNMYSAIALAVKNLNKTAEIYNYEYDNIDQISEDAKVVMTAFFSDHPEVFYLDLTYKVYISKTMVYNVVKIELSYSVKDKAHLDSILTQMDDVINAYLNDTQNLNLFDKQVYLHDNLARNVRYYDEIKDLGQIPQKYHSIFGSLLEKQAVCDGITKAMQLLLDRAGIENIFVTGIVEDTPHAWNMVKLNNEWYHMDTTSNKYVKEPDGNTRIIAHTYFNVTDSFISKTHLIDYKELLPIANATGYNYYKVTDTYIYSLQNFENRIKEIVNKQRNSVAIEFATDMFNVPEKLLNELYEMNFNNYKEKGRNVRMKYFNERETYIVVKE